MLNEGLETLYVNGLNAQRPGDYSAAYDEESRKTRADIECVLNVAYGDHPRQTFDLFPPQSDKPSPLIVFFHGGYWRANSKDSRSFLARSWVDEGCAFALANYRIAPGGTLTDMMSDATGAYNAIVERAATFQIDPAKIVLAGNSAGAHLAAIAAARGTRPPLGACLLSGLFDLRPLLSTSIAQSLDLSRDEAEAGSPIFGEVSPAPTAIFVGGEETPAFIAQSRLFHHHRLSFDAPSSFEVLSGENHFSIIRRLGEPDSAIGAAISKMIA